MTADKCQWCGLHEIDDGTTDIVFACGSSRRCLDMWFQSVGCEEILNLRKRIADAVAALAAIERIERNEAGADVGFERVSEHGDWVLFEDLEPVRDILTGNSPKESEDEQ